MKKIVAKLKIPLFFVIILITGFFIFNHLFWKYSRATNDYQITLGNNLILNLNTDLPNGTRNLKFFVMKKTTPDPTKNRPEHFGVSGVNGEWDLHPDMVYWFNAYWGSKKTGDEMLDRNFAMLEAIGVKWIRIDQSWEREEPSQGIFDFQFVDKIVSAAKRHNLQIMMSLSYTPSWSYNQCSGKPASSPHFTTPIDLNTNGSAYYNRFATKMVERYKPHGMFDPNSGYGISYWQIWNEPDSGFWVDCKTGQVGNLQTYAYLVRSVYPKIKAIDPNAKVIMGGLTHISPAQRLTSLYGFLPGKQFDLLDVHNYEDVNSFARKITVLADVRNSKGDSSKQIWLSETSTVNNPGNPTDPTQSNYLKSIFEKFESLIPTGNLGKAFWWSSRDYWFGPEAGQSSNPDNAIFNNNFYPRKVYFDLGEWLGTIKYKGEAPGIAIVNSGKINTVIPKNLLNETGDYLILYASSSKMVTALPLSVKVVNPIGTFPPTPTATPNMPIRSRFTPTINPALQNRNIITTPPTQGNLPKIKIKDRFGDK
jgi:hypothetical protein